LSLPECKRTLWQCGLGAAALAAALALWVQPAAAQNEPRGENFSARPAPQLFASDCTGAGCHRSPQGLARSQSQGSLTSFLREHYTNSRESAAALAGYLLGARGAPPAEAARTRPAARSSRAAAQPEEAAPDARSRGTAEPGEAAPKPAPPARGQRGRQTAATPPTPAPPPEPEPAAAPEPPKPKFDIFD
jgi:hypothetical protein